MKTFDTQNLNLPKNYNKYCFTKYLTPATLLFEKNVSELKEFYKLKDEEITYLKQSLDHACIIVYNHYQFDESDIDDIIRFIKDPVVFFCYWKPPQIFYKIENDFEKLKNIKKYFDIEDIENFIGSAVSNRKFNLIKNMMECGYNVSDSFSIGYPLAKLTIEDTENIDIILNLYSSKNNYNGLQQDILYYMNENISDDILVKIINKIGKDTILSINKNSHYIKNTFTGTILELALIWGDTLLWSDGIDKNGILNKNIFKYVDTISNNFRNNVLNGRICFVDNCETILWEVEKYDKESINELLLKIKKYCLKNQISASDFDFINSLFQ
jgi:hypothetical protein